MSLNFKKVTVITGHYGCGKTNLAVNLALFFAKQGEPVTVIDLDIVNPYYRTNDFKDLFDEYVRNNTTDKRILLKRRYYGIVGKK